MYAKFLGRAMGFQQHAVHISNFPFFSGATCVSAFGQRLLYRFDKRCARICVDRKVLPINDENQLNAVTVILFIKLAFRI